MNDALVIINAGSSSVRLDLFRAGARIRQEHFSSADIEEKVALRAFAGEDKVRAVVHRVVHGGASSSDLCLVSARVEAEIRAAARFAPVHNFRALRWIEASRQAFGSEVAQIAAFDTAFYAGLPDVSRRYAIPKALEQRYAIRRYGFHGLAHESMLRRWQTIAGPAPDARTISLQLGSGCSMTAVRNGRAVDTSMGFSPLEGLVMATRSGDLDPGLVIYLQGEQPPGAQGLDEILNNRSGLLGMAGDADMQRLLQRSDPDARAAVELYCYRARKYLGAYLAALGGAHAILFGGGVGENAPEIRARILQGMSWCGVEIDDVANRAASGDALVSASSSLIQVWTIAVDEAALMAGKAEDLLKKETS